jgi:small conductance mechanosensitive channel
MENLSFLDPQAAVDTLVGFLPKLAAALLVLLVFWVGARLSQPALRAALRRADFADTLIKLLVDNLYRFAVLVVGAIMAASQVGIDVGAAIAGLGVAGVALGFAAQDSVANTIAGFLIFWDKPFLVGQQITTQGRYGEVTNITMRTTRIRTANNIYIVVPNRQIIEDAILNHSLHGGLRVDVPVGIAYNEDISAAREALLAVARTAEGVSSSREPAVVVAELADSSVNLELRVWIEEAAREKAVYVALLEAAKVALDEAGIEIPFPHLQLAIDEFKEPVQAHLRELVTAGRG